MPREERLSAIAKRRRLNGDGPTKFNSPISNTRSQSPAVATTEDIGQNSLGPNDAVTSEIEDNDENTFSALVDRDVVQFSNFREIEKLSNEVFKIRLSKGQKCFVTGRYSMWVKEGTIDLFGSKLEASPEVYHAQFVAMFEVPPIVALSNIVEFELHSETDGTLPWLTPDSYVWSIPSSNDPHELSFFVHGYSVPANGALPPTIKEFDSNSVRDSTRKLNKFWFGTNGVSPCTTVLCGRESSVTGMLLLSIINTMVTTWTSAQNKGPNPGVLLLDLDSELPTFAPPKTMSLVHIARPLLGAPFTSPGVIDFAEATDPHKVLWMQFFDSGESSINASQIGVISTYLNQLRRNQYRQSPLIIKACGWLEYLNPDDISTVMKMVNPDSMISLGAETASNAVQLTDMLVAQDNNLFVTHLPAINAKGPALHIQHEFLLRSYFHSRGYKSGCPIWSTFPMEHDQRGQVWLTYGTQPALISSICIPGIEVDTEDVTCVLNGCVVAISVRRMHSGDDDRPTERDGTKCFDKPVDRKQSLASSEERAPLLGYGIVAGLDLARHEICLLTPIPYQVFESLQKTGGQIHLLAQKVDSEGRFDTSWVQLESDTASDLQRTKKAIHRQRLNIKI